jgi:excisionase family DNA binding protein
MNSTRDDNSKLIDIEEAARILKVHKETLRRWDNSGKLKAVRVGSRKDRKYKAADIINALENRK